VIQRRIGYNWNDAPLLFILTIWVVLILQFAMAAVRACPGCTSDRWPCRGCGSATAVPFADPAGYYAGRDRHPHAGREHDSL